MPKVSASEGADKWGRRTKQATADVTAGVNRVTVAPTQQAAAKIDKMRSKFNEAVDSGKVERGLQRVSLQDWKTSMTQIGVGRIASGVDNKGISKMGEFAAEFYPHLERVEAEIAAMPDTTLEDNVQRAVHNIRRNAEFKRS